jgi:VWFA-related protein
VGRTSRVASVWMVVAACGWLAAVPSAQQAAPQQPPTFQASAQLVQVDVRVFDRDGRFVDDLTVEDFEVFDLGTSQPVRAVFYVGAPAGAAPGSAPLVTSRGPSGVSSGPVAAAAKQTWIFVFDLNHITPGSGFDRARESVRTFIREQFTEGDLGGVVAGSRMVNNRLTSVRSELEQAVDSVKPLGDARSRFTEMTREWPRLRDEAEVLAIANEDREAIQRAAIRACTDDPSACQGSPADMMVRDKARRLRSDLHRAATETLSSMTALANGLARIPGPKTIVFLSGGLVVQGLESTLRAGVGQATRAGARIYAIDVRGLNRGVSADIGDRPAAEANTSAPARMDISLDGPNSLAVDTGGFFIQHENNIGRALTRIADDANRYYVLGYQPENLTLDGQYRTIEVRVKRPGVTVRARRGYLALPASQLLMPQPIKR